MAQKYLVQDPVMQISLLVYNLEPTGKHNLHNDALSRRISTSLLDGNLYFTSLRFL